MPLRHIAEALSTSTPPTSSRLSEADWREKFPEEFCPRCGVVLPLEDGRLREHRCCTCRDTGRVRVPVMEGEPLWARAVMCPDCQAKVVTRHGEALAQAEVRMAMRIPTLDRNACLSMWPDGAWPRVVGESYLQEWPPPKPLLALVGPLGAGKTLMACAILRELHERHGLLGEFWPVVALLDRLRRTIGREGETVGDIEAEMRRLPLLVLDDLGMEQGTDWAGERIDALIDDRYREMRPLVVTSNGANIPPRVGSRFSHESIATVVQFQARDRRPGS